MTEQKTTEQPAAEQPPATKAPRRNAKTQRPLKLKAGQRIFPGGWETAR